MRIIPRLPSVSSQGSDQHFFDQQIDRRRKKGRSREKLGRERDRMREREREYSESVRMIA